MYGVYYRIGGSSAKCFAVCEVGVFRFYTALYVQRSGECHAALWVENCERKVYGSRLVKKIFRFIGEMITLNQVSAGGA